MHRTITKSSLAVASGLALMAGASAQATPQTLQAERVTSPVKHAGIYHVATGSWTRTGGAMANFGPDVIYSNTAASGYYSSAGGAGGFAPGATNFDEGLIPGTTNPNHTANRDEYNVNCIEIGYCDFNAAATGGWELGFYNSYAPCTYDPTPDNVVQMAGLPATGCWMVVLDLTGGEEFCLASDGGNGYSGSTGLDSFGWSFRYTGTGGTAAAGFLLAADPASTDPNYVLGGLPSDGTNTYYGPPSLCGQDVATGNTTQDFWWLEDPAGTNSNCFWFGGYSNNNGCGGPFNPYASWFLELQADTGLCASNFGDIYCTSNPNSTGAVSGISLLGSAVATDDNVRLGATLPPNSFGFFITSQTPGMVANPGGSEGILCLSGSVGRFVGPGQIMNSGAAGTMDLDTNAGQWSVAAIPTPTGPYGAATGITTHFQLWHRDVGSTGPTSNFSDAIRVTWQ